MWPPMLRRACDTAAVDDLTDRLAAATADLEALRDAVVAREPWPLSEAYGVEPESDWGPKEVLAHVAEMLPFWLGQIDRILATPAADGPPPFGRVSTDPNRIARIGADRMLAAGELFDRAAEGAVAVERRVGELAPADLARSGVHARLGEMTVPAIVERFIVGHLEEHVRQLDEVLARG
jgi:hypothetical protein